MTSEGVRAKRDAPTSLLVFVSIAQIRLAPMALPPLSEGAAPTATRPERGG
jgi:hypothetical protein